MAGLMFSGCGKRAVSLSVCTEQVVLVVFIVNVNGGHSDGSKTAQLQVVRPEDAADARWERTARAKQMQKCHMFGSLCNNTFQRIGLFFQSLLRRKVISVRDSLPPADVKRPSPPPPATRSHDSLLLTRVSKQIVNRFPTNLLLCLGVAVRWLRLLLSIPPSAC